MGSEIYAAHLVVLAGVHLLILVHNREARGYTEYSLSIQLASLFDESTNQLVNSSPESV